MIGGEECGLHLRQHRMDVEDLSLVGGIRERLEALQRSLRVGSQMTKAVDDARVGSLTNLCTHVITEGYIYTLYACALEEHHYSATVQRKYTPSKLMRFVHSHQAPGTMAEDNRYNLGDGNKIYNRIE